MSKKRLLYLPLIFILLNTYMLYAQVDTPVTSVEELDQQAEEYYKQRDFTRAMRIWLGILADDPENVRIQQKIERLYEEKHKKDISVQMAKRSYREAWSVLYQNIDKGEVAANKAIEYFVTAYQIDPADPELKELRIEMKRLQDEMENERRRKRLAEKLKMEYAELLAQAQLAMQENRFEGAIELWDKILKYVPNDQAALEGKNTAQLAISNRIRYEKIKSLMSNGIQLFTVKDYQKALSEFEQVLLLDPQYRDAIKYKKQIEYILQENMLAENRRIQAETFYSSAMSNIKSDNYDAAQDDLENVLSLIENYKDAKSWLSKIPSLKNEYLEREKRRKYETIDREFQNGLVSLNAGQYQDALASFRRILELDPDNKLAAQYERNTLDALKDKEDEVVDRDSPYFDIINPLITSGKILYDKGSFIESRKMWEKILTIFPKNKLALQYLLRCDMKINPQRYKEYSEKIVFEGKELLAKNDYKAALKKFELIKSIDPDYVEIDQLIVKSRNVEKIVRTPKAPPAVIEARYQAGLNYYRKGDAENLQLALNEFQWVVANDPENVKAIINMNKIQTQLRPGSLVTTTSNRKVLTEEQKALVRKYYFNGINYYSNNQFDKAIEEWRKVIAIDPDNTKARNNIKKCLILLGK